MVQDGAGMLPDYISWEIAMASWNQIAMLVVEGSKGIGVRFSKPPSYDYLPIPESPALLPGFSFVPTRDSLTPQPWRMTPGCVRELPVGLLCR